MIRRGVLVATLMCAASALGQSHPGIFADVTATVGLDFRHDPGATGRYFMPEIMGSGGALFDADGDGDLDVYLIQAGSDAVNRLFVQETDGTFRDVTARSGLGDRGYGMGVAVGDVDNDGDSDVYVTNYGRDSLYRNEGSGRFRDVSSTAGIHRDAWSTSATFCDYDGDGWLDLYVAHYVDYDPSRNCSQDDGSADYCSPQVFAGTSDSLLRNRGDGAFVDVAPSSGIAGSALPGLGVVCLDGNGDDRLDFYVANDGAANQLWINQGDGTFSDDAVLLGVAFNELGRAEAGMGVAAGDVDGDEDLDLFVTNLTSETNTLYTNEGPFGFEDATARAGLSAVGLRWTGFGTGFADFDHDGDLDLAVVNGRVQRHPTLPGADLGDAWNPYAEPNLLLENVGAGRFTDASAAAGALTSGLEISRGLSLGDVDGDGDVDLLVTSTAGPARLLRNESEKKGNWLSVRAYDPATKRDAFGARITVEAGGASYVRVVHPGSGYLSSSEPRAHFGVPSSVVDRIRVRWPGGHEEIFSGVKTNQAIVLFRGDGAGHAR